MLRNKRKESVWSVSRFGRFFFVGSSFLFVLFESKISFSFLCFFLLFSSRTNSFQPARTSTKEIHKFIFLGLFRDLEQPKPVSFCLSLPLSSKEGRRSAFTTSLTPSPPSPFSFFSSILTTPIKKCFATLHPLSLSLFLSLSFSSSSSFFRRRHRNNKKEKN